MMLLHETGGMEGRVCILIQARRTFFYFWWEEYDWFTRLTDDATA